MSRILIALVLAATPMAATAQGMNAETFHQRAQALKKKGAMAIFSRGEIKKLTTEAQAAASALANSGSPPSRPATKPRYCPPEPGAGWTATSSWSGWAPFPRPSGRGST